MTINCCDVCGIRWDPQVQNHRLGIDCARGLRDAIDGLTAQLKKLLHHVQELEEMHEEEKEATIDTFRKMSERTEALAKRVQLLEHPNLAKVPGMKDAKAKAGQK